MNSVECSEDIYGPKRDSIYVVISMTVVYLIIFITGTFGNVSTCIVISKNKTMHTATNFYLFSLAISDLLLLLMGLPPEIYSFWSRYPYIFGNTFCFMRGLFAEISGNATVLTITAFTVERYLAICHPFLSHTMSKLSRAVKFIIFIWTLSICFAIPQAMPLKVVGDCPRCIVVNDKVIDHAFEISTLLFFVAPMTIIIILYVLIGSKLHSSRIIERRMVSSSIRNQNNSSRNVVKMLGKSNVLFLGYLLHKFKRTRHF